MIHNNKYEYSAALNYLIKAKDIFEMKLPKNSLELAEIYYYLGVGFYSFNDLDNSNIYLKKALAILENNFGTNNERCTYIKNIINQMGNN